MATKNLLPPHLQRLWFVHATAHDKGLLNIGADIEIRGDFSVDDLKTAFAAAVIRHEAFRLKFVLGSSGVEWELTAQHLWQWRVIDATALASAVCEEIHAFVAVAERLPLANDDGALVCASLFLIGHQRAVLAVTVHHLVADAWTVKVLVHDIMREWRRFNEEESTSPLLPNDGLRFLSMETENCPAVSGKSDCTQFTLHLDREIPPHARSGSGAEETVVIGVTIYRRLRDIFGASGHTRFAAMAGVLYGHLATLTGTQKVETGILVSMRKILRDRHAAGCFVRPLSVSVELSNDSKMLQVIEEVSKQLRGPYCGSSQRVDQSQRRFPVMISMVRDSSDRLHSPSCCSVNYVRRRRVQSECDLHIFFYDRGAECDVVFNYDSDVLDASTVRSWAEGYLMALECACEEPNRLVFSPTGAQTCPTPAASREVVNRLQHIALAAWEMDIGLRRLSAAGMFLQANPVEDDQRGVVMALTGLSSALQLEVVAPLREDSPCVGTLIRDGEGPYHCCWRVSSIDEVLSALDQCDVHYNLVHRDGKSDLFPSENITFLLVDGVGLIEFLHDAPCNDRKWNYETTPPGIKLRIDIESDDAPNARKILQILQYQKEMSLSTKSVGEIWTSSDGSNEVCLVQTNGLQYSRIACVSIIHRQNSLPHSLGLERSSSPAESATSWWSRFRTEPHII